MDPMKSTPLLMMQVVKTMKTKMAAMTMRAEMRTMMTRLADLEDLAGRRTAYQLH
jgi:hypothetical protein